MKLLLILLFSFSCFSQSYLQDYNGDGAVTVLGFGDSLSWGVGDGTSPGKSVVDFPITDGTQGYLKRVREMAGVLTVNGGYPGEIFTDGGFKRFPRVLAASKADVVVIFDGNNDTGFKVAASDYRSKMQTIINISMLYGIKIVLVTLPSTCCDHAGRDIFSDALNAVLKNQSGWNSVRLADVNRAWKTTCTRIGTRDDDCDLFNLPEGLHPNKKGYNVIAEVVLASLYGIDPFTPTGISDLASALGKSSADITLKPGI